MTVVLSDKVFVCFSAKDRYDIAEPIVFHLENYGIDVWYDRYELILGDDRHLKNLIEGASRCRYACVIISENTRKSRCAMEELSIVETRSRKNDVVLFPILYELSPDDLPEEFRWIVRFIFKEVTEESGSREACSHIACRLTEDVKKQCKYQSIKEIVFSCSASIPPILKCILSDYLEVDKSNLNARVALLYSTYLVVMDLVGLVDDARVLMCAKIFTRLFDETRLLLKVDYRELWLLENSICILVDYLSRFRSESNI